MPNLPAGCSNPGVMSVRKTSVRVLPAVSCDMIVRRGKMKGLCLNKCPIDLILSNVPCCGTPVPDSRRANPVSCAVNNMAELVRFLYSRLHTNGRLGIKLHKCP